jgi:hypothetical protein
MASLIARRRPERSRLLNSNEATPQTDKACVGGLRGAGVVR